jgi:hypothetical protein
MSKITIINDAEQAALVSNNAVTAGKLYLKAEGSTNAGDVVIYNGSAWKTFANEVLGFNISTRELEGTIQASSPSNPSGEVTIAYGTDTEDLYIWNGSVWYTYNND